MEHLPQDVVGSEPDPSSWDFWRSRFDHSLRGTPWKEAGLWAIQKLQEHLEDDWLNRTIDKYRAVKAEYIVPAILALAPAHTIAYAELLELMLRLELLREQDGVERLKGILDGDPVEHQLLHLRLQLEVGALAAHAGQRVTFELLSKEGLGPADVVMGLGVEKVVVEIKVILLDDPTREHHSATDRLFGQLHVLELRHSIECAGEFGEKLEGSELDTLLISAEICARQAHDTGEQQILEGWGSRIAFSPPGQELASGLHGAVHRTLGWQRTARILRKKAWQCRHQSAVWLRMDALDGLWQFTPWASTDLGTKLEALIGPLRETLSEYPYVDGIVITSGAALAQGVFFGESARLGDCYALRRLIEPLRVRETMIIPMNIGADRATEMWRDLYDEEPTWLDWALERKGLPSVQEIFVPSGS